MNQYNDAKIYKISSPQTVNVYIGSTTKPLNARMSKHKTAHKQGVLITSSIILEFGDARIELIESFPCESKEDLLARERHWIENTENVVNRYIPGRTAEEKAALHRQCSLKKHRCECGGRYITANGARHRTRKNIENIWFRDTQLCCAELHQTFGLVSRHTALLC